ncbi:MAG TPA: cell division protein FtsQ/DivIB [Burkholderiales bacterium]|nr:cell division protein FtsQ/DivIB [Burkholderiales bacterium]
MWDNPRVLNRITALLHALAALLLAYAALVLISQLPAFAWRHIDIRGDTRHISREAVATIVRRDLRGNFFTLDLGSARAAFEQLPWVKRATLRREWPDRLDVVLVEHVPLARWNGKALVDAHGEVFGVGDVDGLPQFFGPPGTSKDVTAQYDTFRRVLAAIHHVPQRVELTARGAWRVKLDDGMTLELGRTQMDQRLARFVAVYGRTIGTLGRKVDYVDLRYPNGFAVRIPGLDSGQRSAKRHSTA